MQTQTIIRKARLAVDLARLMLPKSTPVEKIEDRALYYMDFTIGEIRHRIRKRQ